MSGARPRKTPVWQPGPEHLALVPPGASGNAVNGLGETEPRRATPVFWTRPEKIPHGQVQERFMERFFKVDAYKDIYKLADRGPAKLSEPAPARAEVPPAEWTRRLKEYALANGADLVGIARLDRAWLFEGQDDPLPWVVVFGMRMDHARLSMAPATPENPDSQVEVHDQYNRGARAANRTAQWLREAGFQSTSYPGPWAKALLMVPAALACGFGELGKHGSIINREFGSSFRLSAVSTDMPLEPDARDTFGADDFCTNCRICVDACPPDAIFHEKQIVRGEQRWYVDFDKCIPYFTETYGCGICIAVCPWSTPGRAPTLAERWTRRAAERASGALQARHEAERQEHAARLAAKSAAGDPKGKGD
jgi:epoxyqueuosine reductase